MKYELTIYKDNGDEIEIKMMLDLKYPVDKDRARILVMSIASTICEDLYYLYKAKLLCLDTDCEFVLDENNMWKFKG
jgi:hypothetical protein